jgi:hypothetical protein
VTAVTEPDPAGTARSPLAVFGRWVLPGPELGGDGVRNVFVVGLDAENAVSLRSVRQAPTARFLPLLDHEEVRGLEEFPFDDLVDEARRRLQAGGERVDAICSYWDFPVGEMVAVLGAELGLPTPPLEVLVRTQHKYWSRLVQQQVAPEAVPGFVAVDPHAHRPDVAIEAPYWLKPVRSFRSHLAYRIRREGDLPGALAEIREGIGRLADAYAPVLARVDLPPEIAAIDGSWCIAEQAVHGRQCTLEGFVWRGEVTVYGAVDSIRMPNRSSFARYEYPSRLPGRVREAMVDITERVVRALGYDDAPFNAEFFWDEKEDRIWLLEINARQSQSHAELFEQVDGRSNHEVMVALALGERPVMPRGTGQHRVAAKLFLRRDRDGVVRCAPTPEQVRAIEARHPGSSILVRVEPGQRLSELPDEDAYSFELGAVSIGGPNRQALRRTFDSIVAELGVKIDDR